MLTVAIALLVTAPRADVADRMKEAGLVDLRQTKVAKGDLEIRFWDGGGAYVLQCKHTVWSGEYLPSSPTAAAVHLNPPRSGWDGWWKALGELDLLTLLNQHPSLHNVVADGFTHLVEINDGGKYRQYSYKIPDCQVLPYRQIGEDPTFTKFWRIDQFMSDEFESQIPPGLIEITVSKPSKKGGH